MSSSDTAVGHVASIPAASPTGLAPILVVAVLFGFSVATERSVDDVGDDPAAVLEALARGLANKFLHHPSQALSRAPAAEREAPQLGRGTPAREGRLARRGRSRRGHVFNRMQGGMGRCKEKSTGAL